MGEHKLLWIGVTVPTAPTAFLLELTAPTASQRPNLVPGSPVPSLSVILEPSQCKVLLTKWILSPIAYQKLTLSHLRLIKRPFFLPFPEGVYVLRAVIYNEFYGTEVELGPYYVEIGHEAVSVFMNSSSVHEDELLVFAGSHRDQKSTVVMHRFPSFSSYNVSFTSQTQVGDSQAWPSITVWYQMQSVSVYTNGTVFSTDTDITFVAVTKETAPLEFVWYFGEDPPVRTTSRSIKKRLGIPQWYRVLVTASNGIGSVASEPHHIRVQRRIVANRLTSTSSALVNASVTFECRINFGTDVAYLWNFGDGAVGLGNSSATHVYSREGEFTVEVLAFNNVSSASLRKQLFIVRQPCQPPPVKNMGPGKVQVWRSQPLKLGVTFEAEVLCDISQGLSYTWSFMNSVGLPVPLPPAISSHGKTITVPSYFLEPGNYTALAKVQVEGSAVHSNYCIGVEVRARAPVSLISEGTHLFISRTPSATIVLSGSSSYDPDEPGAALRYHWKCTAASTPGHTCFPASAPRGLHASAPTLSFAANSLSDSYDQFLVTLMVSSDGRTSSEAQVFLSTRPDLAFRFVHISRVNFKDIFVNWNEELSLQAECEGCGEISNLSYSWDLFLVNATEKNSIEVPFCRTVGLLGSSEFGAVLKLSGSNLPSLEPRRADPYATTTPSSWKPWPETPSQPALSAAGRTSTESTIGMHWAPTAGDPAAPGGAPRNEGSPGPTPSGRSLPPQNLSPHSPDFEAYYSDIQEAMPSKGRQPGTNINLPGSGPSASADGSRGDGDNLVGPFLPTVSARPALLVDWPKSVVSRAVFHGYTSSGITEKTVTIKPYSLSPGETYVLQASVGSKHSLLGKAQLYLTVNPAPQDVACQVQPHHGLEAHTVFSVFCMSGRLDFRYEFSYQIGNTSKHTLYRGRDSQYYFALPAGEPLDNYKVMVSTEITDGEGSQVQPCSVAVTVRPRFHGNHCLGEDVYNSSLKNLSTLQLMGSYTETRNYITMITRVLSRWAKEDRSPSCGQWSRIQDALISSVCRLAFTDQEEMTDSVYMLRDLIRFPKKLSFTSAVLILKYTQTLLTQSQFSGRFVVDKERMLELILLVSGVLEVSDHEKTRKVDYLREEGIKVISDLLLGCLSSNSERQLHVSTGQMEIRTLLHHDLRSSVQSLGPVQVHLPGELAGQSPAGTGTQSPCYISQLMLFKKNPYPGGRAPSQVGRVLALSLYSCSSRTPISGHRLRKPVTVEFGEEDGLDNRRNKTTFVLLRDKVNFHQFIGLSENPQESLQIRIEFSKPLTRAFPVMLLVRFSEKPTPSDFLVKQIYFWDEQIVHIYIPAVSLRDTNLGYLSLLDADYDRKPPNKYLAKSVNYAVHFQWIQCLFWDTREWKSESFSPQPGTSPEKVNCSYHRLAAFSVARRRLNASFETSDISKLQGHPENLLPGIFIVVFTILYVLLVTKSRRVDHHEKKKTGYIFLQENAPPDHQLYAVVVDTGFRAPARFSAKVYIVLCGENGLSEPKELYCAEKPLFERNSRHTFILSAPAPLGPLRKLRLWHDGRGHSPAWYVSHVMVKELRAGQGQSWLFPAECWLAVSRQDGRVERELACLTRGLGFRKLLYAKFTEYLEDFHVWTSVLSRPSCSTFLHTPRLTVAFTLLCSYSCLAALLTAVGQEQLTLDVGPSDVTLGSFWTGFLCTLLASPGALLLSLFFRLSQVPAAGLHGPVLLGGTLIARTPSLNNLLTSAGSQWASRSRAVLAPERSADGGSSETHCSPVAEGTPALVRLCSVGPLRDGVHGLWLGDGISRIQPSASPGTPDDDECVVLAARRQARRLRWARPPSTAQLRMTRDRMRREMRTREALRDISMYILMLLLHLFIIYGKFSRDEYSLNRAIQNEFTRNARSFLGGLRSMDDWWDWSLTTLLDGLYQESSSTAGMLGAQPGALGGKCYLIGPSVIKQMKVPLGSLCELPSPPSGHFEDSLPTPSPTVGSPESPSMIDPEIEGVAPSGPGGCREDCALSLGRTRPAARAALARLRASRWINCSTRAVSVHFTLYNPPTRLFSSVSLSAEMLPTGGLALSSLVESFHIFRSNSARYHLILPELVFLVLNLIHLCFQLYGMTEKGVRNYWRKPRSWLELSIVGVAFAYYASSGHLGTLAGEVTDQFHKGFFQGLADLSHMASWNQKARWLQGILSFLLILKCIYLPGIQNTVMSCSFKMCRSLSSIFAPGLVGVLMLAAHIHLCGFLLSTRALPSGIFADSFHGLLVHFPGRSQRPTFLGLSKSDRRDMAWYYGAFFIAVTTLWFGMLRGFLMSLGQKRKSFPSKSLVRLKDVTAYMWGKTFSLLGLERPKLEETEMVQNHNYYLDEFADLLDELLLKINGLSDSLQLSFLEQQSNDTVEARAEDSPLAGVSAYQATGGSGYSAPPDPLQSDGACGCFWILSCSRWRRLVPWNGQLPWVTIWISAENEGEAYGRLSAARPDEGAIQREQRAGGTLSGLRPASRTFSPGGPSGASPEKLPSADLGQRGQRGLLLRSRPAAPAAAPGPRRAGQSREGAQACGSYDSRSCVQRLRRPPPLSPGSSGGHTPLFSPQQHRSHNCKQLRLAF
ncbi:PREDICTED: polycystic kidney disease protein 1-like 1 [Ceratotherium simum simum]|uniref:Polycystic kidney disease protein 1-like 1 n=1 Tax=Ceratotherium simum simum TaxID=73337 RepID=A0ABM1DBB5_CERSS|nr:PREDICTED: polycystic kidney disease protein 1-like 1 [Ceratotherium simum simum]